ncbi:MAG: 6-phosphogluconolactonase [Acidimicrobiales bacterium]
MRPAAEALTATRAVDDVPAGFASLLQARFQGRPGARFVLFLSGGSTAAACYDRAATDAEVDWSLVDIYMGDERCVPADDRDANQRLVREHLVEPLGGVGSFTPMAADPDPERGASGYDAVVGEVLAGPGIDLIHLGLGPDGHTASLFPGAPSLEVTDRRALATEDPSGRNPHPRLTVTYPVIDAARTAVFTVAGPEKHDAVARIRGGEDLPAARVATPDIRWLLDGGASEGPSQ